MFSSISLATGRPPKAAAAVVGQFKGEKLDRRSAEIDADGYAAWTASQPESTGDLGSVATAYPGEGPPRVFIVGLGPRDGFEPGVLRTAGAALARAANRAKVTALSLELDRALGALDDPPAKHACGRTLGEGLGIAGWHCDEFRGSATTKPERGKLRVFAGDKAIAAGVTEGLALAEGTNLARTLSQTPPNVATPMWIANEARRVADETGLACTVIHGEELEAARLTGLATVGAASENEPCLVRLDYTPSSGDPEAKPVVLVGKTITYDTGGLSIKTGGSMRGMKRDKDGGCGVLGAMHNIAAVVKPKIPVTALLACAENSISDEAYRPDDVLTFRNGVTVEVTNTDAEGRLVMADALCYACDELGPRAIVDFATLTGGVVVALGKAFAGMWCDDDELRGAIEAAGAFTGERVWRLPHDEHYRAMMKSPVADIVNSAPVREAHPIQGAAFLSYFCEPGVPWAHVDIAGVHEVDKTTGPFDAGPTGFGARLAAEIVSRLNA